MSIIKGTNQIVAGFGGTKRSIGEVYFSQSALATDNSGALPLFTGETIASANTIYPEFYNWILAHTELQCTSTEYESALTTYGECPKYVIINSTPTRYKWENPTTGVLYTLSRNPAVGDLAYDVTGNSSWPITEASSTEIVVPTFGDNKPLSYVEEVAGTSASLRLPLLKNYIKAANPSEGIKNIEAGLPNITGVKDSVQLRSSSDTSQSGALYSVSSSSNSYGGSGNWAAIKLGFDASRSSAVYGKSSTVTPASTTLYPWVFAFSAAVPASTAQAAQFQAALSGKVDVPSGKTQADVDFVVESYHGEDGNWYRKYKSGWVEQGGYGKGNITFLKPYSSLPNVITGSANKTGDGWPARANEVTATGFYLYGGNQDTVSAYWEAKGQGGENV